MKQKIVLIIAVGMGILAFVLTYVYLENEREALYADAARVSILVAREALPAGTVLRSQDIRTIEVFETGLSRQVFRADRISYLLGKTLRFGLEKDSPIDWVHVGANLDELSGLASTIRSGMRAISIPVSGESAVSGLVRPNDNVDILGTFSFMDEANPGEMETVTFTVLQDVTVLATGQETARAELEVAGARRRGSYNTVTIAVFPEEAELLAFAMNVRGNLTLSLRNPNDISVMEQTPPIDFQTLQRELPRLNEKRQDTLRGRGNTERLSR
jgi:pilus assembly protein CpaB